MAITAQLGPPPNAAQFRGPVSCCLFQTWRAISEWTNCKLLPREVGRELCLAMCLLPIMTTNLRVRADLLVTCSDASETGAGVAVVAGLSSYGVNAARSLPTVLPDPVMKGFVLLSLFGGIEASRRALDLLGLRPVLHISVEIKRRQSELRLSCIPISSHIATSGNTCAHRSTKALLVSRWTLCWSRAAALAEGLVGQTPDARASPTREPNCFFQTTRIIQQLREENTSLNTSTKTLPQ